MTHVPPLPPDSAPAAPAADGWLRAPSMARTGALIAAIGLLTKVTGFLPITCVAAVLAAALNAAGRFATPALGPLLFNLAILLAIPYSSRQNLIPLGIGVLAGGILQLMIQLPVLRVTLLADRSVLRLSHP